MQTQLHVSFNKDFQKTLKLQILPHWNCPDNKINETEDSWSIKKKKKKKKKKNTN